MKTGRKPTPTETLKLHGNFRSDRHGERADVAPAGGVPERPSHFNADELALWEQVVPNLVRLKLVGEKDTAELVSMCELWGLYRASYEIARSAPTDKEARCAVTGYWAAFDRVASKFGMTSVDYANLKVPKDEGKKPIPARTRA